LIGIKAPREIIMSNVAGTSRVPPAISNLICALNDDTDLVAVLRGQLYVEAVLAEIVATKYVGPCPVERLTYMNKVVIARDNRLIESRDRTMLQELGHIRDSFAHLPIKTALTSADDASIVKAIPNLLNTRFYAFIAPLMNQDQSMPGVMVRSGILYLYHRLVLCLGKVHNQSAG
jgi:hypothetical protein